MPAPIGDVVELVGPDGPAGLGCVQRFGQTSRIAHVIVGIGVGNGRHFDQLGAGKAKQVLLLLRLGVGDDDDGTVAERAGHHGDADAGIAGGALDDHAARPQGAAGDGVLNDRQRRAVLDRPAGIYEFGLAEDRASGRLRRGGETNERRSTDGADDVAMEGHAGFPVWSRGH